MGSITHSAIKYSENICVTRETIPKSIQLIAGRVGQSYNNRKKRNGAFGEDRYHATAVTMDDHLYRCMTYVDLNMVRAGVVEHPSEWSFCGYDEIQNPPERYTLIDYERLMHLPTLLQHNILGWLFIDIHPEFSDD